MPDTIQSVELTGLTPFILMVIIGFGIYKRLVCFAVRILLNDRAFGLSACTIVAHLTTLLQQILLNFELPFTMALKFVLILQ